MYVVCTVQKRLHRKRSSLKPLEKDVCYVWIKGVDDVFKLMSWSSPLSMQIMYGICLDQHFVCEKSLASASRPRVLLWLGKTYVVSAAMYGVPKCGVLCPFLDQS